MSEYLVYWKNYWSDLAELGDPVDETWHTSKRSFWNQVLPGDALWVVTTGGLVSNEWRLVQRIEIANKQILKRVDWRYRLSGNPKKALHLNIEGQPNLEPLLKALIFESGKKIRSSGRQIGNALQSPRQLIDSDVERLEKWAQSLVVRFGPGRRLPFTREELVLCLYVARYGVVDIGGIDEIHRLNLRSRASIKLKIQNIVAMLDERGISRDRRESPLTGLPAGKIGRSTNWELVAEYLPIPREEHFQQCVAIINSTYSWPGELAGEATYQEGSLRKVIVNSYERDPQARKKCIDHYGVTCFVCGFDFGTVYGAEVFGFIHVHHLKPLSEVGNGYRVDPIEDMRPLCPNCHAVVHLGKETRTMEEMKLLLTKL